MAGRTMNGEHRGGVGALAGGAEWRSGPDAATSRTRRIALLAAVVAASAVAVVIAAVALRFIDLGANPGGLYTDEGAEGYSAVRLLHWSGLPPIWFTDDGGREALFAYLVAAVFQLFGATPLALRATAAAIGVAGVGAIWLLGRRFGTWTGLVAAAWAAGSLWLVAVSRDGMRNTLVPFAGALALVALLWWAARPGRWRAAVAGGLVSLAAFYTYQPLKLLPVLLVVWLLWLRRAYRPAYERLRPGFVTCGAALVAVASPMAVVAFTDPTSYFGRAAAVSPFNPGVSAESGPLDHLLRTLGMLTIVGDPNARHDVAAIPLLGPPIVAWPLFVLAVIGVAMLWRRRREPGHALVLLALPLFAAVPLVAVEGGSPHFLRTLGLAAPLGVAIGLGATGLVEWAARRPWLRGAATAAIAACLAGAAVLTATAYLGRPVEDRYGSYRYDLTALAAAARCDRCAAIAGGDDATTIRFLDADAPPAILDPATRAVDPSRYTRIFALSRDDLSRVAGPAVTATAVPIATDPSGSPTVWSARP